MAQAVGNFQSQKSVFNLREWNKKRGKENDLETCLFQKRSIFWLASLWGRDIYTILKR